MSRGRLLCIDKPHHLKFRFGKGIKLSVTASAHNTENVQQHLIQRYPSIQLQSCVGRKAVFLVPSSDEETKEPTKVPQVMADLLELKLLGKVEDWAMQQCSIEEVFLNLIQEDELLD